MLSQQLDAIARFSQIRVYTEIYILNIEYIFYIGVALIISLYKF